MTAIKVEIPGHLLPWQRAVRTASGRVLTTARQRSYQELVRMAWARALGWDGSGARYPSTWPMDRRYCVALVITWPDARRRDLDNAIKQILDALNGCAWEDDSQVDALLVLRTGPGSTPIARVVVSTMGALDAASVVGWWLELSARSVVGRLAALLGGGSE